jgi:Flp pilus assembly protein TadD
MAEDEFGALHLARHYVDVDRPQAALDALARVSGDALAEPEYWAVRAEALLHLERYGDGAEAAERGLEQDPEDISLLDVLAICRLERDDFAGAEQALATALELSPENPLLLAHRALVLARSKRFAEAREAVDQAMRVAPDWTPVLRVRAQVAVLADDPAASWYVDELLERDPEDRIGHALRGNLAAKQRRFVSASRSFDQAARLDPTDPELAEVAREARVAAHPVLAPLRPIYRFGRWRSYFLYLALAFGLAAAGLQSLRVVLAIVWISLVLLSWIGPRVLRWRQKRRYGGF